MGFISTKAHTIIGLIVGVALIFAAGIFGFADNDAASTTSLWVGIFIVVNELITTSPYSPFKLVPMKVHMTIDVITGLFLLISPWLFGFMDTAHTNQWLPHVIFGVLTMGYALLTSTADERQKSVAS
jgi:hypothetical protein